ncbi:MAG: hypothetical protein A2091_00080 [Desulfuromonadales bacterium GWD2_61_12]|nr:MAG: hypothetical protein A2005_11010 [Desulfuromonadales bacterium GWC2_61_20]OGR36203.1 MAG: hypothetical protein A2091_00080 [Desulfuromonadales bacterium GWD2_61_12]HBT84075.1 hypothetical protein [Desulfuromonas sp.]
MLRMLYAILGLVVALSLGGADAAAADKAPAQPSAVKTGKSAKVVKAGKSSQATKGGWRRLSLMPAFCVEQFIAPEPYLDLAPPRTPAKSDGSVASEAAMALPRLGLQTDWGVVPFVGSALSPLADSPARKSVDSGMPEAENSPFCELDAGVSYNLGRSTNLNLGYSLPNTVWSGVLGPLNAAEAEPSGKKVSIGIDIDF